MIMCSCAARRRDTHGAGRQPIDETLAQAAPGRFTTRAEKTSLRVRTSAKSCALASKIAKSASGRSRASSAIRWPRSCSACAPRYGRSVRVTSSHSVFTMDVVFRLKRGADLLGDRMVAPHTLKLPDTAPQRLDLLKTLPCSVCSRPAVGCVARPSKTSASTGWSAASPNIRSSPNRAWPSAEVRDELAARITPLGPSEPYALRCHRHRSALHVLWLGEGRLAPRPSVTSAPTSMPWVWTALSLWRRSHRRHPSAARVQHAVPRLRRQRRARLAAALRTHDGRSRTWAGRSRRHRALARALPATWRSSIMSPSMNTCSPAFFTAEGSCSDRNGIRLGHRQRQCRIKEMSAQRLARVAFGIEPQLYHYADRCSRSNSSTAPQHAGPQCSSSPAPSRLPSAFPISS